MRRRYQCIPAHSWVSILLDLVINCTILLVIHCPITIHMLTLNNMTVIFQTIQAPNKAHLLPALVWWLICMIMDLYVQGLTCSTYVKTFIMSVVLKLSSILTYATGKWAMYDSCMCLLITHDYDTPQGSWVVERLPSMLLNSCTSRAPPRGIVAGSTAVTKTNAEFQQR